MTGDRQSDAAPSTVPASHRADAPRYRIQTVSERTGVPSVTLRAWERRYGVPAPVRSPDSKYRLFSENDVARVRRMQALIADGMRAREAAHIALEEGATANAPRSAQLERARQDILRAAQSLQPQSVHDAVHRSLEQDRPGRVFEDIFVPVLRTLGNRWAQDEEGISHEHLASTAILAALDRSLQSRQPSHPRGTILLAAVAGERHVLPLYGPAFAATEHGFLALVLGGDTPPRAIHEACKLVSPEALGLSLTHDDGRPASNPWTAYADAAGSIPWIVGGAGASAHATAIEAAGGQVGRTAGDWRALLLSL